MKMSVLASLVLLGLLSVYSQAQSVGCGVQAPAYTPVFSKTLRILGGNEAKPHSWPWIIYTKAFSESGNSYSFCSASVIRVKDDKETSDFLLTAAHCLKNRVAERVNVYAGLHDNTAKSEQKSVAAQLFIHPTYGNNVNDIGLIKLVTPLNFTETIRPVCLPQQGEMLPVGQKCAMAGWGRTTDAGNAAKKLKQGLVDVHPAAICQKNDFGGWGKTYKEDAMVCSGALDGSQRTCNGDSGGPLACQRADGAWVLYGDNSFGGSTCSKKGQPDIYARVSSYVDWIKQTVEQYSTV